MPDTEDLRLAESDSGIDLSHGNVCPMCGAQNNGDQTHCWQCRALLLQNRPVGHVTPGIAERSQQLDSGMRHRTDRGYFWGAFTLLLVAAVLGGQQIARGLYAPPPAPESFIAFFQHHMTMTRVVLGAGAIMLSPLLLNLILRLYSIKPQHTNQRILLIAVIPPSLAFALSWLPPIAFPLALLAPGLLAGILLFRGLSLSTLPAIAVWASHGLALGLLAATGFFALESLQAKQLLEPLKEFPALRAAAHPVDHEEHILVVDTGTISPTFTWNSSKSAWLDHRGNQSQIEIQEQDPSEREVELVESRTGTVIARWNTSSPSRRSKLFVPTIDVSYEVRIPVGFLQGDSVAIRSLIPVETR